VRGSFAYFILFFIISSIFFSCSVLAEELKSETLNKSLIIDEASQFKLAGELFDEGDYFRAITEYKRFIYFFPESNLLEMAYFKIGEAYFKGKRWEDAIHAFERLREKFPEGKLTDMSYYLTGMAYFYKKDYSSSRKQFKKIIDSFTTSELIDDAMLQIAMSYVEEEKWLEALGSFRGIGKESNLYHFAENFASGLGEMDKLPLKSPALAGTLAAILPGAGHFYTGRERDGTTALLLNGAFIWGALESYNNKNYTVAGILTFFELGWYFGNIYSAVSSAHKYNKRLKNEYIKGLKEKGGISLGINPVNKSYYLTFNFYF
jgi:outer membrane protein assembly factor BamD (BamD/ComL family)/TM2 domain-containing membrane protein YozV